MAGYYLSGGGVWELPALKFGGDTSECEKVKIEKLKHTLLEEVITSLSN